MSTFFSFRNQGLQNSIIIRLICFNYRIKSVFLSSCFFFLLAIGFSKNGYRLSVISYKRFVINKKPSFTDG